MSSSTINTLIFKFAKPLRSVTGVLLRSTWASLGKARSCETSLNGVPRRLMTFIPELFVKGLRSLTKLLSARKVRRSFISLKGERSGNFRVRNI